MSYVKASSFLLTAEDASGSPLTVFNQPVTVTINYTDTNVVGLVESRLALYYWDEQAGAWLDALSTCPDGAYQRDLEGNRLSLPICHLSEFALFGNSFYQTFIPMVKVDR